MANQKSNALGNKSNSFGFTSPVLYTSKDMHRQLKKNVSIGNIGRSIDPMYYTESIFGDWKHSVNGWAPPEGEDHQQQKAANDTSVNRFHLEVWNSPHRADIYDGPYVQEVRIWKGDRQFGAADESEIINCPQWPYVCFLAVLRCPERFL